MLTALTPLHSAVLHDMDRLTSDLLGRLPTRPARRAGNGTLRLRDTGDRYQVAADVPGAKPEDVQVEASRTSLTLSASRTLAEHPDARSVRRERRSWSFTRTFELSSPIDPDAVEAQLKDGLLLITAPKLSSAMPRQIPVRTGGDDDLA